MFLEWLEKKCYPDKPLFASAETWSEWHEFERTKPICNFCVNTVPDFIKYKIIKRINNVKYWFLYRFFNEHKYQLIDTGLKPGYYDVDTRMFHGIFNLMKEFCEHEQPYHDWCWLDEPKEKFKPGKEAALKSFAWQKDLVYTEDEIFRDEYKHLIGQPTPQALNATELEKIYLWWVDIFHNRKDPYEVFKDEYFSNLVKEKNTMKAFCERPPEEQEKYNEISKKRDELEKQYADEDEEMLLRLIKIRKSLWT